ncbi:alpha/beta hydrolase [Brevibacterium litoralis]|uniref:alpha/beta hydrolase n=1 Tax=Brevibacterium litoralis TaxID=3138935 RepID=UPI0032EEC242
MTDTTSAPTVDPVDPADVHRPVHVRVEGAGVAVLLLHGITGSPVVWRAIARELSGTPAGSGVSWSAPLLPGHGTHWRDLNRRTYADWYAAAHTELESLAASHDRVVVAGLSMGGALALDLAARTDLVSSVVLVNPAVHVDDPLAFALPLLSRLVPSVPAIGGDIARPGALEYAYDRTPVAAVASLAAGQRILRRHLWRVTAPVSLCLSTTDHVVAPRSARRIAASVGGPFEVVPLRRSLHVATVDHDDHLVAEVLRRHLLAAATGAAPALPTVPAALRVRTHRRTSARPMDPDPANEVPT